MRWQSGGFAHAACGEVEKGAGKDVDRHRWIPESLQDDQRQTDQVGGDFIGSASRVKPYDAERGLQSRPDPQGLGVIDRKWGHIAN